MRDHPSDRAIAQAFLAENADTYNFAVQGFVDRVMARARTLDAAPADPVVSAECWRRAIAEQKYSLIVEQEWPAIEQRALELAKEQSRGR